MLSEHALACNEDLVFYYLNWQYACIK